MSCEHRRSTIADTIVLIHGLWMTPRSWELWVEYYRRPGYEVLAPAYPGLDAEVEELRADPAPIERLTIEETVDHYDAVQWVRALAAASVPLDEATICELHRRIVLRSPPEIAGFKRSSVR